MAILKRPPPVRGVDDPTAVTFPEAPAKTDWKAITPPTGVLWRVKFVAERIAAAVFILLLAPVLLLISLAIVIGSGRPVLFAQPRFGRGAVPFDVYKFRTMRTTMCDVSGAGQTSDQDPRITKVGMILRKTSMDELPQLLNVLRGDMNIIGPRAHPCGMEVNGVLCEKVDPRYHSRHLIVPGITGWAQVNGSRGAVKSKVSLERRVSLDLEYITQWTLWMDIRILFRTLGVLIHRDKGH